MMPILPDILKKITQYYISELGFLGIKYMGRYKSKQIWLLQPPEDKIYGSPILYSYAHGEAKKIIGKQAIKILSTIS